MSRKAHPVGFRLGLTQPWEHLYALYVGQNTMVTKFNLQLWLRNFAQQNGFYFLQAYHLTVGRVFEYLTLLTLMPFTFEVDSYRPTNFYSLNQDLYKIRKRLRVEPYIGPVKKRLALIKYFYAFTENLIGSHEQLAVTRKTTNMRSLWAWWQNIAGTIPKQYYIKNHPKHSFLGWMAPHAFWSQFYAKARRTSKWRHLFHNFSVINNVSKNWIPFWENDNLEFRLMQLNRQMLASNLRQKLYAQEKENGLRVTAPKHWRRWQRWYQARPYEGVYYLFPKVKKVHLVDRHFTTVEYLKFVHYRITILRFKFFFEKLLFQKFKTLFVVQINNFNDVFYFGAFQPDEQLFALVPRLINAALNVTARFSEFVKFRFLGVYANLLVSACILRTPHVLLQWVWMYGHNVRKHSLYLNQPQLLRIFLRSLESAILLIGLLEGVRFEIVGKLNDSTRTRKQLTFYGKTFQRQTLLSSFAYAAKQLPSYIGVFGLRLWLIY